jgi:hypothetical protein
MARASKIGAEITGRYFYPLRSLSQRKFNRVISKVEISRGRRPLPPGSIGRRIASCEQRIKEEQI